MRVEKGVIDRQNPELRVRARLSVEECTTDSENRSDFIVLIINDGANPGALIGVGPGNQYDLVEDRLCHAVNARQERLPLELEVLLRLAHAARQASNEDVTAHRLLES